MMNVRDENGRVVKLVHFRHYQRHLDLLEELQRDPVCCNMPILVDSGSTRYSTPLFKLVLDRGEVRALNPNEPANDRRKRMVG